MFLPLTDLLTCPRCGPESGLILLADRIEDRRVLEGALGCPRCQERYPVRAGFADLRPARVAPGGGAGEGAGAEGAEGAEGTERAGGEGGPGGVGEAAEAESVTAEPSAGVEGVDEREGALRLAALLGIMEGGGYVLLAGPAVRYAAALAALLEGLEVVVVDPSVAAWPEERGLSRIGAAGALPLFSHSMRGVVLSAGTESLLEEAARVLAPGARLILEPASAVLAVRVEEAGLQVRAREGETLVALRA